MFTKDNIPHKFSINDDFMVGNLRKDPSTDKQFDWSEPCMLGIDEAGRGPVLGPMVYGSCIAPISMFEQLKKIGFNDSKQLSVEVRDRLFHEIQDCEFISWITDSISPEMLSSKMLRVPNVSLNVISYDSAINMIHLYIAKGYNIQEVYVDTIGDPKAYQAKLKQIFPNIKTIIVAEKADAKYPIVSAASICAKVTRDYELQDWQFKETKKGITVSSHVGSGYPGDQTTVNWLRHHCDPVFGMPSLARFSWSTTAKHLTEKSHEVSWGDEVKKSNNTSIKAFFSTDEKQPSQVRSQFLQKNQMSLVTDITF